MKLFFYLLIAALILFVLLAMNVYPNGGGLPIPGAKLSKPACFGVELRLGDLSPKTDDDGTYATCLGFVAYGKGDGGKFNLPLSRGIISLLTAVGLL